jgi:hypothetical protein
MQPVRIEPVSIRDLIRDYPDLRPTVIDGVLRRGETASRFLLEILRGALQTADRAGNPKFQGDKPRIRDLRPGDQVVFQGLRRMVVKVEIFR